MEIICVKNYDDMSEKATSIIADHIKLHPQSTLGLATGSTPEGLYKRLIEKNQQKDFSFKEVTTFNLDEYVGLSKDDPNSYHYYMNNKLFAHIDIELKNVHIPNGIAADQEQECQNYEDLIKKNKIDIQILGIGLNGHIGFNEPGTPFLSRTHIVDLAESTIKANSRFFDKIEDVPTKAVTMGIETIMEADKIILLVSGEQKADTVERLINGEVTENFPASILQTHSNVIIIADEAALGKVEIK